MKAKADIQKLKVFRGQGPHTHQFAAFFFQCFFNQTRVTV